MNLLGTLLKTFLTEAAVKALAQKTGLSQAQLKKLIPLAIPLLLKFLTSNASSQNGALSLLGALTQHTSQKSLAEQLGEADEVDGGKILAHILGGESEKAIGSLAGQTGLSDAQVSNALSNLAPALMSSLSAANSGNGGFDLSDGLDMGDILSLMGSGNSSSGSSLLGTLLGGAASQESAFNGAGLLSALGAFRK